MTEKRKKYARLRKKMVNKQLKRRGITEEEIREAFLTVPRQKFVPEDLKEKAYQDRPLPIGEEQTISQPYIVALMLQALEPEPEDVVLEIGTGSGYAAAVLSRIVDKVYGLERLPELALRGQLNCKQLGYDNVLIESGDGTIGLPEKAPFNGILVSAAAPDVPDSLLDQLAEEGTLVIPVGSRYTQKLLKIKKKDGTFTRENLGGVRFVSLVGEEGW